MATSATAVKDSASETRGEEHIPHEDVGSEKDSPNLLQWKAALVIGAVRLISLICTVLNRVLAIERRKYSYCAVAT